MIRKWVGGVALAVASGTAMAGNWVFVGSGQGQSFYVDTSSIVRDGSDVRVWADSTYDVATVLHGDARATAYILAHFSFDCAMRIERLVALTSYDMDRHVIHTNTFEEARTVDFAPDTIGDAIRRKACQ